MLLSLISIDQSLASDEAIEQLPKSPRGRSYPAGAGGSRSRADRRSIEWDSRFEVTPYLTCLAGRPGTRSRRTVNLLSRPSRIDGAVSGERRVQFGSRPSGIGRQMRARRFLGRCPSRSYLVELTVANQGETNEHRADRCCQSFGPSMMTNSPPL